MDAESIARALDKPRRSGKSWLACCPAHPDKNPSLAITVTERGKVLVKCFAGCDQQAVIEALRARGLWPDTTPQQKHIAAQRERRREVDHHRLILRIAKADMRAGKPITPRIASEIKQSIRVLRDGGQ